MRRNVVRKILLILLAFIWLCMAGTLVALAGVTHIKWWIPVGVSLVAAGVAVWPLRGVWTWVTGFDKLWINIPAGILIITVALSSLFYGINYFGSDTEAAIDKTAVVAGKYSEERYRTRRLARGRTTRGEKYYAYFLQLRMEDGTIFNRQVGTGAYISARVGDKMSYEVERGALGFDVVKFTNSRDKDR